MAIVVAKVELKTVMDASGMEACIKAGTFRGPTRVIAVYRQDRGQWRRPTILPVFWPIRLFRTVAPRSSATAATADIREKFPWCVVRWVRWRDPRPHATVFARNAQTGAGVEAPAS